MNKGLDTSFVKLSISFLKIPKITFPNKEVLLTSPASTERKGAAVTPAPSLPQPDKQTPLCKTQDATARSDQ